MVQRSLNPGAGAGAGTGAGRPPAAPLPSRLSSSSSSPRSGSTPRAPPRTTAAVSPRSSSSPPAAGSAPRCLRVGWSAGRAGLRALPGHRRLSGARLRSRIAVSSGVAAPRRPNNSRVDIQQFNVSLEEKVFQTTWNRTFGCLKPLNSFRLACGGSSKAAFLCGYYLSAPRGRSGTATLPAQAAQSGWPRAGPTGWSAAQGGRPAWSLPPRRQRSLLFSQPTAFFSFFFSVPSSFSIFLPLL